MKHTAILLATIVARAAAEVPQEQSHRGILLTTQDNLQLNNPLEIVDPVFGLLGDKAAADGAGLVTNLKCLQQNTADQAFTNAKEAGDLDGQVNALLFRALERNTGSVGLASELCDETAVNPEVAALTQHQDPASDNAQQLNKDLVLALAVQLASIGADPTLALLSGTFLAGDVNDPTGAGNTCNDDQDAIGCIFTENLIVADASIDEINAAVADAMGANAPEADAAAADDLGALAAAMMAGNVEAASADAAADDAEAADADVAAAADQATGTVNVQSFTGDLGGPAPPVISSASDRPFEVNGATFLNAGAAIQRSCAVQKNACANAANSGQVDGGVQACDAQEDACKAAANLRRRALTKAKRHFVKRQATPTVNVQAFNGQLGGPPPAINSNAANDKPFEVNGDTFLNAGAAIQRSCDVQKNACASAANSGQLDGGVAQCDAQRAQCVSANQGLVKRAEGLIVKTRQVGALDLGACSNPAIQFAEGLDGRKEASFGPVNTADFNHGSALNIAIIADFICQRLGSSCDAPDDTVATCEQGAAAAKAASGEAAAQAFNDALGV